MPEKVFCIGFPKTGTTSLEVALQTLGYRVCRGNGQNNHSNYLMALAVHRDYAELERMIGHFDAFADLPWGGTDLYLWLRERYPRARFIYTEREPHSWVESVLHLASSANPDPLLALEAAHAAGRYGAVLLMQRLWGLHNLVEAGPKLLELYQRHTAEVSRCFAGQDNFLRLHILANPAWKGLCEFLRKAVPDEPFPHENRYRQPAL